MQWAINFKLFRLRVVVMSNAKLVYEPSKTTHWKNLFAKKCMLLGSHNLNEGEELVAQIVSVDISEIKNQQGKTERVPVVNFANCAPMVLNITNTRTIVSMYGEHYDRWSGCYVQLFSAIIKVKGVQQSALRIRPTIPNVGVDTSQYENNLRNCRNVNDLKNVFMSIPKNIRQQLTPLKDQIKGSFNANT